MVGIHDILAMGLAGISRVDTGLASLTDRQRQQGCTLPLRVQLVTLAHGGSVLLVVT